jgi:hypothetical protein
MPRQTRNDCVVVAYREITGADEDAAQKCFSDKQTTSEGGFSLAALSDCLMSAGFMLTEQLESFTPQYCPQGGAVDEVKFKEVWTRFRGVAVVGYNKDGATMRHVVVVKDGGMVFDRSSFNATNGEFILDHFYRVGGKIDVKEIAIVTRMLG